MLRSLDDLTRFTAVAADASFPIKDVFFSLSDRTLVYLLVDTGSWFDSDTVLVSAGLISDVSTDARTLTLDTDESQIRAAPEWHEEHASLLSAMPPIVVGPFGNTISPAMMVAIASASMESEPADTTLTQTLEHYGKIKGMDVFGSDNQLGTLVDLLVDFETRKITHLVIDNGKVLAGRQLLVPIEKLRYQAEQGTHLVLALTSSELEDAPQIETADRLDRNWIDVLRTYYRLPT
ncbi:PRC-barrel domain-containing protein [Aestuariivita sp.]|jgi:uncharacterized protein YrrD|uniref:PRC-barrel domain containing protein n=1 Tax=Aestuariivita sp. TaxID=1872407 RepID=UPI002173C821|nr:PRC-barrel domain-containing protein [Aestuariivita sp.]MCE8006133.1 PRC-barrel domain containing protein [Aestuariivita sp.]